MLKAQSSKPQGLSTLLGQRKAHLMKHALGKPFLALFEEAQSKLIWWLSLPNNNKYKKF